MILFYQPRRQLIKQPKKELLSRKLLPEHWKQPKPEWKQRKIWFLFSEKPLYMLHNAKESKTRELWLVITKFWD